MRRPGYDFARHLEGMPGLCFVPSRHSHFRRPASQRRKGRIGPVKDARSGHPRLLDLLWRPPSLINDEHNQYGNGMPESRFQKCPPKRARRNKNVMPEGRRCRYQVDLGYLTAQQQVEQVAEENVMRGFPLEEKHGAHRLQPESIRNRIQKRRAVIHANHWRNKFARLSPTQKDCSPQLTAHGLAFPSFDVTTVLACLNRMTIAARRAMSGLSFDPIL